MKKLVKVLIIAQIVLLVFIPMSFAASGKCTVKKVEGSDLVINCGKNGGDFKVKDKIKIKSVRKEAVEGC